jgi:hypothetical protein
LFSDSTARFALGILKGRLPRLRIARPAWKREFEQAGEALLLDLLGRAFVLARTIGARYETNEGLSVKLAMPALKLVDRVNEPSVAPEEIGPYGCAG